MSVYLTSEGDMLDAICWKFYGTTENRVVERVLAANFGLADLGPSLPAGRRVILPAIEKPAQRQGVKLWD